MTLKKYQLNFKDTLRFHFCFLLYFLWSGFNLWLKAATEEYYLTNSIFRCIGVFPKYFGFMDCINVDAAWAVFDGLFDSLLLKFLCTDYYWLYLGVLTDILSICIARALYNNTLSEVLMGDITVLDSIDILDDIFNGIAIFDVTLDAI